MRLRDEYTRRNRSQRTRTLAWNRCQRKSCSRFLHAARASPRIFFSFFYFPFFFFSLRLLPYFSLFGARSGPLWTVSRRWIEVEKSRSNRGGTAAFKELEGSLSGCKIARRTFGTFTNLPAAFFSRSRKAGSLCERDGLGILSFSEKKKERKVLRSVRVLSFCSRFVQWMLKVYRYFKFLIARL